MKGVAMYPLIKVPELMLHFSLWRAGQKFPRVWSEQGHSWVRNAYNYFFACVTDAGGDDVNDFGAGFMGAKSTAGSIYRDSTKSQDRESVNVPGTVGMVSSTATHLVGIAVGSDDTAFDIDDFALGDIITHGSGAGQLSYGVQERPVISYDAKVWTAQHIRTFSNLSGDQIDVKEVGFFRKQMIFSTSQYFMMSRDVLAAVIEIPSLAVLQVKLDITQDFTAID
jgi:hypothetical protein